MNWPSILTAGLSKHSQRIEKEPILPINTQSLCPECLNVIDAVIDQCGQEVFMEKDCPEHGSFRELISSDARFYKLLIKRDNARLRGVSNPNECYDKSCPSACGLCQNHLAPPVMMNIDLTNRCNLNCPICFANANERGEVVELSMERLKKLLDISCEVDEIQPACLQLTGGEPTVHPQFMEALIEAHKRDFAQIQIATNGLKFAKNPDFAHQASDAGLNIAYLQFDGLSDDIYEKTRGRALLETKLKAIDNMSSAGIRTVLVPTIVKGVNDHQVGDIAKFAIENTEKISGISWQPVAFTGRIDYKKRLAQRFTLADLTRAIQDQSGYADMYRDWYPFGFVDPFSRLLEETNGPGQTKLGCSPTCGVATYMVVDPQTREVTPLPAFVDVEPMMQTLSDTADQLKNKRFFRKLTLAQNLKSLKKHFHQEKAPRNWTFDTLADFMMDFADFKQRYTDNTTRRQIVEEKPYRVLLMASMHFQDVYNYQLDRVGRCVIHYAAPDGKIYPFCTYNSGPCHRSRVESEHAISLEEYRKQLRQTK